MHELYAEILKTLNGYESCIAITGGGGKTTCMIKLASLYSKQKKRVLLSTTTKLMLPSDVEYGCDSYFFDSSVFSHMPKEGERVFYARKGEKALTPPIEEIDRLRSLYDVIILEADGSRHLGLKLHNQGDPVVPSFVTATIAIASFATLKKPFAENCFGSELYAQDFPEQLVDIETLKKLLLHKEGITKRMTGKGVVLFNQVTSNQIDACRELSDSVSLPYPLFFGSLKQNILYYRKDL
ncbi:putative selenium-dependent hydroxylase accessory protein YqeC [Sphaerochaeta pleomorpha str. Grapes]|uniref:Putative selenium-dependent hydroxylase accessory protein YqeC n=1 Tax=Sphaerochaeta pleomorpha (strain ATCC BAA-1885 / DSM 22778 / Grapes) TaxID=158190 RepID=G8QT60_SPHPG|nr:selenium cofactor biosynthesis protein YqeC [Sphaerochaeta pleomorpha]AEV27965.1 putative selenium-dependent hydroxylase accessory protein YqeC [Sphaerochaeta pleomorpha str. Grapes]